MMIRLIACALVAGVLSVCGAFAQTASSGRGPLAICSWFQSEETPGAQLIGERQPPRVTLDFDPSALISQTESRRRQPPFSDVVDPPGKLGPALDPLTDDGIGKEQKKQPIGGSIEQENRALGSGKEQEKLAIAGSTEQEERALSVSKDATAKTMKTFVGVAEERWLMNVSAVGAMHRLYQVDRSTSGARKAVRDALNKNGCDGAIVDSIPFVEFGVRRKHPFDGVEVEYLPSSKFGVEMIPSYPGMFSVDPARLPLADLERYILEERRRSYAGGYPAAHQQARHEAQFDENAVLEANRRWASVDFMGECARNIRAVERICDGSLNRELFARVLADTNHDPKASGIQLIPIIPIIGILIAVYEADQTYIKEQWKKELVRSVHSIETIQEKIKGNEDFLKQAQANPVETLPKGLPEETREVLVKQAKAELVDLNKQLTKERVLLKQAEARSGEFAPDRERLLGKPGSSIFDPEQIDAAWRALLVSVESQRKRCAGDPEISLRMPNRNGRLGPQGMTCDFKAALAEIQVLGIRPAAELYVPFVPAKPDKRRHTPGLDLPDCDLSAVKCRVIFDTAVRKAGYEEGLTEYCALYGCEKWWESFIREPECARGDIVCASRR